MEDSRRQCGFSLIETMLAVGTLAVGMMFVGGTFMAGVYFASVSTERTMATVVTDEAIAKITLRGLDPNNAKLKVSGFVLYADVVGMDANDPEFCYPSLSGDPNKEYSWSAVCRREASDSRCVEFTIFVSRLAGRNAGYWARSMGATWPRLQRLNPLTPTAPPLPQPLLLNVTLGPGTNELSIADSDPMDGVDENLFVDGGSLLVDNNSGQIYRVLDRNGATPNRVTIDPAWRGATTPNQNGFWVWVVPRPAAGGRNPLVTVYQKVIRF